MRADHFEACLLHFHYLLTKSGHEHWRELFQVLEFSDGLLAVQHVTPFLKLMGVAYDGSIAGKSIALSLAALDEQIAGNHRVAEHISIIHEWVKLWIASTLAALLASEFRQRGIMLSNLV